MDDNTEDGSKSGEMSGDSLVINEDVEEDREDEEESSNKEEGPPGATSNNLPPPPESEWEEEEEQEGESGIPCGAPKEEQTRSPPAAATEAVVQQPQPLPRKITTLNVPSVTVSSHALPPVTAPLPPLPPGTIAKPVVDPSRGETPPDEDGHDPTVRKLIIMAIDVMKNRKARPDGKRISNWINRRYGRPVVSINEELEKMVVGGELTRVDYKGSASYRITTAEAKSARRRRRLQKNQSAISTPSVTTTTNSNSMPQVREGTGGLTVEPILRQPNLVTSSSSSSKGQIPQQLQMSIPTQPQIQLTSHPSGSQKIHTPNPNTHHQLPPPPPPPPPPPFNPPTHAAYIHPPPTLAATPIHPHYHQQTKFIAPQEITLRTLVCDYMADLSSSGIPIGDEIDIKFIGRSVDVSRRPINRGAVLANLENILEKEIQAGHFIKTSEDLYVMQPSIVGGYHQIPSSSPMAGQPFILSPASITNTIINPAPMPPPPSAGPPPFLSTSSAPPPPQIVNVGSLSGPNLSEYMYNHPSSQVAIPLTVTSASRQAVLNAPPPPHPPPNGRILPNPNNPPPTTTPSTNHSAIVSSNSSSLASATPPLPNFTKMTFISSGTPKALTSAVSTHNTSSPSVCVSLTPVGQEMMMHGGGGHTSLNNSQGGGESTKSDEERKNDLIQEKVFKMNKSFEKYSPKDHRKSSSKNSSHSESTPTPISSSNEPIYVRLREKRNNSSINHVNGSSRQGLNKVNLYLEHFPSVNPSSSSSTTTTTTKEVAQVVSSAPPPAPPRRVGRPKKNSRVVKQPPENKRRKKEVEEEDVDEDEEDEEEEDEDDEAGHEEWKNKSASSSSKSSSLESTGIGSNTRSSRKKKSRKIFDPADHETPSRKRKAVNNSSPSPSVDEEDTVKEDTCLCCEGGASKNKKGKPESLLKCRDCSNIFHPSCLDYTEDLTKKILEAPFWQCINCKVCSKCESQKDDHLLIFCDGCDMGYHRECHSPKVPNKTGSNGPWECHQCTKTPKAEGVNNGTHHLPMEPLAEIKRNESAESLENNANGIKLQQNNRFVPILPPHFHPHTGNLPDNWEDYLPDPEIPDVSYWDPKQVEEHFLRMGFSPDQAHVFLEQEIDGKSLLLLQRSDVTSSLGLKLGPALKIFNHIKKLQTRRHFPG